MIGREKLLRLKPEIKKVWLSALRSGKFRQCKSRLKKSTGVEGRGKYSYCCLGVLCEIVVWEGIISEPIWATPRYHSGSEAKFDGREDELPSKVIRWAFQDVKKDIISFDVYDRLVRIPAITTKSKNCIYTLADLNDSGYAFQRIADIIEKNL